MNRITATLVIVALVALDQASKFWTVANLALGERMDVLPFLGLLHARNHGIAWSMLDGLGQWPLVALAGVVLVIVAWLWAQVPRERWLSHWGFMLIVAGAIGNVIDRATLGYVVDMIHFHIDAIDYRFAIFNVADTWISLGAAAVVIDELLSWRRERAASDTRET